MTSHRPLLGRGGRSLRAVGLSENYENCIHTFRGTVSVMPCWAISARRCVLSSLYVPASIQANKSSSNGMISVPGMTTGTVSGTVQTCP